MIKRIILFSLSVALLSACTQTGRNSISKLKCEYRTDPMGIDVPATRLSWEIESNSRGVLQQAYQIIASSSEEKLGKDEGDLWSTGKVSSDKSIDVKYGGTPLASGATCYWKVKVWTSDGKETKWSAPAKWSAGLLQKSDWQAKWIGFDSAFAWEKAKATDTFTSLSARYLRKDFSVAKKIKKATAYISGLGLYELYINGEKVGNDVLAPGPSEYNKRVFYNTFDITSQLKEGANTVGVILGNGRYFYMRGNAPGLSQYTHYGYPKLISQINITYEDGTEDKVVSDGSWKLTGDGPIVANSEYDGEDYDARKELTGWNKPGYDAGKWIPAQLVTQTSQLVTQPDNGIKVMDTVKAMHITEIKPGVFIYDMGQNFVGWVHLKVKGTKGNKVSMRFAERLKDDSTLYIANLRSAKVTDNYILKGDGEENWEPRFTYHGFRYVEVTGYPGKPSLADIEGRVVYDDMETSGQFESSNAVLNQIYRNAYWGIRSNYRGMPTDCPQRDERMGWLGDRAAGARGESFIFNNHSMYAKWLQDIEDAQSPEGSIPDVAPTYWKIYSDNMTWPAAYLTIANLLYEQYGDDQPIRQHYASMQKWMNYMKGKYMKDDILTKDTYGDWCVPPESPELIHSKDSTRRTAGDFLGTAFYYHMLTLMDRFATIVGDNTTDYKAQEERIRTAFNNKFLHDGYYANNTPTANIFSLAYKLAPAEVKDSVFQHIVRKTLGVYNGHISTGLVGAEWLMRTLSDNGRGDIAYQLATNTTYPSWGYMAQHGATTIWELWNGNTADPSMNSGNHVMLLGDLVVWYYEYLGGIKPDAPAYKKIIMKPLVVGDLTKVDAAYHSPYGWINSDWKVEGKTFTWKISIPVNTQAEVYIPATSDKQVKEGNRAISGDDGVKLLKTEGGFAVYTVGSGDYVFSSQQ